MRGCRRRSYRSAAPHIYLEIWLSYRHDYGGIEEFPAGRPNHNRDFGGGTRVEGAHLPMSGGPGRVQRDVFKINSSRWSGTKRVPDRDPAEVLTEVAGLVCGNAIGQNGSSY